MFFEIFHKGRAACADFIVIPARSLALFENITHRIFEVPRPEVRYGLNICIIGLAAVVKFIVHPKFLVNSTGSLLRNLLLYLSLIHI